MLFCATESETKLFESGFIMTEFDFGRFKSGGTVYALRRYKIFSLSPRLNFMKKFLRNRHD